MARPKDDASTSIVEIVNAFISRLNSEMDSWVKSRKAEIDKAQKAKDPKSKVPLPNPVPAISVKLDPAADTAARTPFEKATQVAAGRCDVCWSARMADRARHVIMKIDAKVDFDPPKTL